MDTVSIWLAVLFVVCLLMACFFSSAETSFIGTQKIRLQHLAESGRPGAKTVARIVETPEKVLALTLLGLNFFESAMATIGTVIAVSLWGQNLGAAFATMILTVVTLVFAEYVPKSLASRHGETLALAYAGTIDVLMKVFSPLIWILNHVGVRFSRLFGEPEVKPTITEEEFHTLISVGSREGTVEEKEAEMLHNVFDFGARLVREVMIPRPEVTFIEKGTTFTDFLATYKTQPQSRFPVFAESRDNVVGVLSTKDILMAQAEGKFDNDAPIDDMVRPALFAPETKPIGDLLVEMRDKNQHLCIVVDEHGGTAGIVTMEELVSEIVGPVGEELTGRQEEYEMLDESTFQIDGAMDIGEANEKMELGLPEGDYDTVAGFVLYLIGRIPTQGEQLKYKDLKIAMTKVTGVKIDEVLVTKEKPKGEALPDSQ